MPDSLDLEAISDALLAEMQGGSVRFDRNAYIEKTQALHRLVVVYVTNALCEWNVYRVPGERHEVPELIARLQISERHEKLLSRWLNVLCDERLLARDAQGFVSTEPLSAQSPAAFLDAAMRHWPEAPELVNCMRGCGENLRAILTGGKSALEFLFPAGSFQVAEAIYERSAPWQYCNGLLAKAMQIIATGWELDRPLRILEVGAGVGGTTKSLLPVLAGVNAEFVFTDVSKSFLTKANKRFGATHVCSVRFLISRKNLSHKGFSPASFDVIVAANVLHATTDIRVTMRRVHSLLQPRGVLLLMELTENQTWLDIIFALLDGWARHSDDIRTDRPTLSIPQWRTLLAATGFSSVRQFPTNLADAQAVSNTVFIVKVSE